MFTYGTGINFCHCKNSNFINQHLEHILTRDLQIMENDKLRKIISKGPIYKKSKTNNCEKFKDNIITAINNLI